jgi:hypothetical protein
MRDTHPTQIHATGEGTGFIPAPGDKGKPIIVIGSNSTRFESLALPAFRTLLYNREAPVGPILW